MNIIATVKSKTALTPNEIVKDLEDRGFKLKQNYVYTVNHSVECVATESKKSVIVEVPQKLYISTGSTPSPTPVDPYLSYKDKAGNSYTAKKIGDVYMSEQNFYYNDGGDGIYNFLGAPEEVGLAYNDEAIKRIELPAGWHILSLQDYDKLGLRFKTNADANTIYTYEEIMNLASMPSALYLMEYKEDTDSYVQLTQATADKLGILYITNGRYKPSDGEVTYGPDTSTPQYNQYLNDTSNGNRLYIHKYAYNGEGYITGIRGDANNYCYQIQLVHS